MKALCTALLDLRKYDFGFILKHNFLWTQSVMIKNDYAKRSLSQDIKNS